MEPKHIKKGRWLLPVLLVLPLLLLILFFLLRSNRPFMNFWVFQIAGPFEQFCGRMWSIFPFSVVELLASILIAGSLIWLILSIVTLCHKKRWQQFLHRILALASVWLWITAIFYWLWNTTYCADSFSERSRLSVHPYSVEELASVTEYFAKHAAQLSLRMERDDGLHWAEDLDYCFDAAPDNFDAILNHFPFLEMPSVKPKPFFLSRLQSRLGFTGIYAPFTGEANINIDAPPFLLPSTICHEMAHQRMVAPEQEANFVGITACISCDDDVFQYSGYLSGLIHLCNALYPVAPERWQAIVQEYFTPEMATDWNDNNAYWKAMSSPIEDISDKVYDAFLKHNNQELGLKSYGACVDLLIAWYSPMISK